jgi:hypothetical protein
VQNNVVMGLDLICKKISLLIKEKQGEILRTYKKMGS